MPVVPQSTYRSPAWLRGAHAQTIVPALFRHVPMVTTERERIELADGDFLDAQWAITPNSKRLAILSHGLEASPRSEYIQGIAETLHQLGWSVMAWNFRGCGGTPNRLLRMYHSGATEDLIAIIQHAMQRFPNSLIDLVGFSLGGNLTLKYLGETPASLPPAIHRAAAISVPCDLACASRTLATPSNWLYMRRFMRKMQARIRRKAIEFPGQIDLTGIDAMRTFAEFDDRYTAPIHGFLNAEDYWQKCSSKPHLTKIKHPTLLLTARNDPFLGPDCYPFDEANENPYLFFEAPAEGGHVGFPGDSLLGENWMERRVVEFLAAPDPHIAIGKSQPSA